VITPTNCRQASVVAATTSLLLLGMAACGRASPVPASGTPAPVSTSSAVAALTYAQGQSICNDLNTWAQTAENQDMPRFNAQLEQDQAEAMSADSQLGTDLASFDDDLQSENSDALLPGPPGDEQPVQQLETDCQAYGVTFTPIPNP
jgi:hypothetical protein